MDLAAEGWHSAFRIELRVQAIEFASRGWPVVPGTYPGWVESGKVDSTSDVNSTNGASANPRPIQSDWLDPARAHTGHPDQADRVAEWWTQEPYSVLVATGSEIEAIEVGAELGRRTAAAMRVMGMPMPIAATPNGRWYFLTRGGQQLDPELATASDVTLHSTGSWLPMPPSTFPQGVMHWRVKPQLCGWVLPEPAQVQDALLMGLHELVDRANVSALMPSVR